jgi:hypothetical protein
MMRKAKHRAFHIGEDVQIGRFGSQAHGSGGQRSLSIEPGTCETCAGKKVCDGLQVAVVIRAACSVYRLAPMLTVARESSAHLERLKSVQAVYPAIRHQPQRKCAQS